MEDLNTTIVPNEPAAKPARVPWNKGKLVGAKPPLRPSHVWSIRTKLQIEARRGTSPCSIWQSTASCVAVTSSLSASITWPQAVIQWTARRSGRRRPAGPCGSS